MAERIGDAVYELDLDSAKFKSGLASAERSAKGFGSSLGSLGATAAKVGLVGVASGAVGLAGALGFAVKEAAGFEQSLNMLKAVSGASGDEMKRISTLAKQLGADVSLPGTSAKDAAEAMLELSKAGLSVNDTMGAARGVLQLSAAGNLSNARAAEIASNALNAFSLAGTQATRVADLLAAAANASSVEVFEVGDALQMAAAVFAAAKMPVEDLVTSIALLGNAGVKGSDAGTSLKQMLLSLQAPSNVAAKLMRQIGFAAYDSSGRMKSMSDIIANLSKATAGMTQQQRDFTLATIFGSDAVRSANILLKEGAAGFETMKTKVTQQGAAAELAAARMKGLNGAIENIKSSVSTVAITIGAALLPILARFANRIAGLVSDLDPLIALISLGFNGGKIGGEWTKVEKAAFKFGQVLHDDVVPALEDFKKWLNDEVLPVAKDFGNWILTKAIPALVDLAPKIAEVGRVLLGDFVLGLQTVYPLARDLFNFIINNKATMIAAIVAIGLAIVFALGPVSAAALALGAIIIAIGEIKKNWDTLKNVPAITLAINVAVGGLGALREAKEILEWIDGHIPGGLGRIASSIAGVAQSLPVIREIGQGVAIVSEAARRGAFTPQTPEKETGGVVIGEPPEGIGGIPGIPALATGGHVLEPGIFQLAEHGPEWVIPDSKIGSPVQSLGDVMGTMSLVDSFQRVNQTTDDWIQTMRIADATQQRALQTTQDWIQTMRIADAQRYQFRQPTPLTEQSAYAEFLRWLNSAVGKAATPEMLQDFSDNLTEAIAQIRAGRVGVLAEDFSLLTDRVVGVTRAFQTAQDVMTTMAIGDAARRPFQTPQDVMTTMAVIDGIKRPLQSVEDFIATMAAADTIRPFQTAEDVIGTAATVQNAQSPSVNVSFQVAGNVEIPERDVIDAVQRFNRQRRTETLRSGASINYSMG